MYLVHMNCHDTPQFPEHRIYSVHNLYDGKPNFWVYQHTFTTPIVFNRFSMLTFKLKRDYKFITKREFFKLRKQGTL